MQTYQPNKFHLEDLYKEIDFYDRKIAYCRSVEKYEMESERATSLGKLQRQRQKLVKIAMKFASDGVTYDPKFLPRSFVQGADGSLAEVEAVGAARGEAR